MAKKKMKSKKKTKTKAIMAKGKGRKGVVAKKKTNIGPRAMASTGAVAMGAPPASPDLMAGVMGSSDVTSPAVIPELAKKRRKKLPAPRRSASPCTGPKVQSPM